jgi:hypothetical protein
MHAPKRQKGEQIRAKQGIGNLLTETKDTESGCSSSLVYKSLNIHIMPRAFKAKLTIPSVPSILRSLDTVAVAAAVEVMQLVPLGAPSSAPRLDKATELSPVPGDKPGDGPDVPPL